MAHKTIVLKGDPLQKEAKGSGTIYPGFVLERTRTIYPGFVLERTSAGLVKAHATQDGDVVPILVAIENSLQGEDIDTSYSDADMVQFVAPRSGDEMYLYLADGENVTAGDLISSNGDGYVKKYTAPVESSGYTGTSYIQAIIGRALETVNTSTSTVGASRVKVEIR